MSNNAPIFDFNNRLLKSARKIIPLPSRNITHNPQEGENGTFKVKAIG